MTVSRAHWDHVYQTKPADSVSWYQPKAESSIAALQRLAVPNTASLIDIGGGASTLVDSLIASGWRDLAVLDIAAPALALAQQRLGDAAGQVSWIVADITGWKPPRRYDVWHDRAVFHFLTEPGQRRHYRDALEAGLAANGLAIFATFALDGPQRCSGLPVQRYDAATLAQELGSAFAPILDWREVHTTPGGAAQAFTWAAFRRR